MEVHKTNVEDKNSSLPNSVKHPEVPNLPRFPFHFLDLNSSLTPPLFCNLPVWLVYPVLLRTAILPPCCPSPLLLPDEGRLLYLRARSLSSAKPSEAPAASPIARDGRHEIWREGQSSDHDNEPRCVRAVRRTCTVTVCPCVYLRTRSPRRGKEEWNLPMRCGRRGDACV